MCTPLRAPAQPCRHPHPPAPPCTPPLLAPTCTFAPTCTPLRPPAPHPSHLQPRAPLSTPPFAPAPSCTPVHPAPLCTPRGCVGSPACTPALLTPACSLTRLHNTAHLRAPPACTSALVRSSSAHVCTVRAPTPPYTHVCTHLHHCAIPCAHPLHSTCDPLHSPASLHQRASPAPMHAPCMQRHPSAPPCMRLHPSAALHVQPLHQRVQPLCTTPAPPHPGVHPHTCSARAAPRTRARVCKLCTRGKLRQGGQGGLSSGRGGGSVGRAPPP